MYDNENDDEANVLEQLRQVLDEIDKKRSFSQMVNTAFKVVGIIFMLMVIAVTLAWIMT